MTRLGCLQNKEETWYTFISEKYAKCYKVLVPFMSLRYCTFHNNFICIMSKKIHAISDGFSRVNTKCILAMFLVY